MRAPLYSPILSALPDDDLAYILGRGRLETYSEGDLIFITGDLPRSIYLVEDGVVKLSTIDGRHREVIVGLSLAGDLVGEVAALEDRAHPFDATAAGPCAVASMPAEELLAVLERSPRASIELARSLSTKLRLMARQTVERTTGPARARLAGRLLELADTLGRMNSGQIEIHLPFSQEELARLSGMCRETACKSLSTLRAQGVLDYEGRRIRVLRPDVLERISCGARVVTPCR